MRQEADLSLGEFGDVRLNKRGRRFSAACFASAVCVCVSWRKGGGLPRWAFGGS